ncbi:NAD(P)-binding protein [Lentinus brumalis]|uniref:NAD(P)-binding protein n=1 Tax=Lentinus brumalis TaxID=2498619 RepID=A0A371D565_9APHY|nr:NAD(P)-binding protein [Polyporus brumalis]
MAGEIIPLGEDVTGWKLGERVCSNFAIDHLFGDVTKEINAKLVRIPECINYEEAATLPCAALTGYSTLIGTNSLKAGDAIVVQSNRRGLELRSPARRRLRRAGHRHIVNCQTVSDWDAEVLQITKGRGVDHVIEVGGPQTLLKSVNCVRYGGTIYTIGSS